MESYKMDINGVGYTIDRIRDERELDIAATQFLKMMADGDGLSAREFESKEAVISKLQIWPSYLIKRSSDMSVAAILALRGSPLVRSEKSIYHAQYFIVLSEHRGKSIAKGISMRAMPPIVADLGYVGSMSRAAMVSNIVRSSVTSKWHFFGVIPNSVCLPKYGWVDDVVCASICDPDREKNWPISEESLEIPPMKRDEAFLPFLKSPLPKVSLPRLSWNGEELILDEPTAAEVFRVEEMIRDAALEGDGFAVDEFNSNGFMNRRLFHKSHMVVIKTQDCTIKGGIVFGATSICRDVDTTQVGGYMVINKIDRGKGLGNAVLDYCFANLGLFGYSAVLTDVFVTNEKMMKMLHKRGFQATASIPNSGIVVGNGRTNTLLMYKPRLDIKQSKL